MSRVRPPVDWERQPLRSLLFAPGNHPRRLERVGEFGSDVIVLDLEDAVANAEKVAARAAGSSCARHLHRPGRRDRAGERRVDRADGGRRRGGGLPRPRLHHRAEGRERRDPAGGLRAARPPRARGGRPGRADPAAADRRDRTRAGALRGARPLGSCPHRHDDLRARRLLRGHRRRPDPRGDRAPLRPLAGGRRRPGRRPACADRRPLPRHPRPRRPRRELAALAAPRLPGPRRRLPRAGRARAARLLGAVRGGARAGATRRRGVRGGGGVRARLDPGRRTVHRLPALLPRPAAAAAARGARRLLRRREREHSASARRPAGRRLRDALRRPGDRLAARRLRRRRRQGRAPARRRAQVDGLAEGRRLALVGARRPQQALRDADALRPARPGADEEARRRRRRADRELPARDARALEPRSRRPARAQPEARDRADDGLRPDRAVQPSARGSGRSPSRSRASRTSTAGPTGRRRCRRSRSATGSRR